MTTDARTTTRSTAAPADNSRQIVLGPRDFWHALVLAAGLVFMIGAAAQPAMLTLYVASNGDDKQSGERPQPQADGGPLRTLAAAQRVARTALAARRAASSGDVRVVIAPGVYVLDEPLVFGPADSGLPGHPMVYQAAEPGTVVISGGQRLAPSAAKAPRGEADFASPSADAAFWASGPQLHVNGTRATLAREPNESADWFVGQPTAVPGEPNTAPGQDGNALGRQAFRASPEALAFVGRLDATDRARALVHIMQSWSSGRHRLIEPAPSTALRVSPPAIRPFLYFGPSQRYYIETVTAALDRPGEWIGTPGGVRYLMRAGETAPPVAILPKLEQLVVIRGAGIDGPFVQNLELRDLGFAHTRAVTSAAGWVDIQAAIDVGAAIQVDFARNIVVRGCHIDATGGYGVWLREGVRDSKVADCTMRDLGAGAVKLGLPKIPTGDSGPTATGANTVTGNRISETGRHYPGAVAIWMGAGYDTEISRNTIFDTTYTGISMGWQWGYGPSASGRNRIVGNALLDIGGGELADLGGIYTLGRSPGTVITDNFIRDVRGYRNQGSGAWGIYNDEGSSDMRVENNVVVGTDSGGYHLHYGRNLLVQGNLFALGDEGEIQVTRSDPTRTKLQLRDNLIVTGAVQPLSLFARTPDAEYSGDLVAPARAGQVPDLKLCGDGCKPSSAVLTVGPVPQQIKLDGIDPEQARRWTRVAAEAGAGREARTSPAATLRGSPPAASVAAALATRPAAPQAPALNAVIDVTTVADHAQPPGWRYQPATPRTAIEAVTDPTAPGKRCLQLNDSASFAQTFEPYLFVSLNHTAGISTASFALRIDADSDVIHEWRDDAVPYRTGPILRITRDGVRVGGRLVAPPVAPGHWRQFRVTAPVTGGAWRLQVTDDDGKVHEAADLAPRSADWRGLRWLGFISNSVTTSTACLANVDVRNAAR